MVLGQQLAFLISGFPTVCHLDSLDWSQQHKMPLSPAQEALTLSCKRGESFQICQWHQSILAS